MKAITSHVRWRWILALALIGLFLAQPTYAALGWVGNMWPTGGSLSNMQEGNDFDVYIQVWKDGVTNLPGQGANITCTLYWGQVEFFGGSWSDITSTPMTYNVDVGNNDEYTASISPSAGQYEFTCYCTDTTDSTDTWQGDGNGRLFVYTPTAVTLSGLTASSGSSAGLALAAALTAALPLGALLIRRRRQ
ncbi:MAG: hypothetical protein KKA73_27130 [Chloroflexi bacterium]|nr:hypothetical protein [Chloroflexota bacterium]MBU1751371.1 hypothetical protein [Chloroflexota bacterium]